MNVTAHASEVKERRRGGEEESRKGGTNLEGAEVGAKLTVKGANR